MKVWIIEMRIFASRYKTSHIKRRRILKRAKKDGYAKIVLENKDGWLYEIDDENLKFIKVNRL